MNIRSRLRDRLHSALEGLAPAADAPVDIAGMAEMVVPSQDPKFGDYQINCAMPLAKALKRPPRDVAQELVGRLQVDDLCAAPEIAGPGFINVTVAPTLWPKVVTAVLAEGDSWGRSDMGQGHKVNVEYVSANPTGPLHVGHTRGAVFGDALASLLAFAGHEVTREYYINDAGTQVDVLARSAFLRYREALGESIGEIPEGLYPGDYLKPVGEALAQRHGKSLLGKDEAEWLPLVRQFTIDSMMDLVREDLAALNIHQDVFFSERSLISGKIDKVAATIADLRAKDLVFQGRLPPPKGEKIDDWEDREQTLFRSTAFGDDLDRALVKSSGGYTYFASDMAYHRDKVQRGFKDMIDVWGADHAGHIKRMVSAVTAISDGKAALDVKICQLVRLFKGGEPFKMSKRSGNFITLRDVVDEVGSDAVRFMMLYRKNDTPLDFDFVKVTEKTRDNPVFYVQYAHARTCSVFRNVAEVFPGISSASEEIRTADTSRLTDEAEQALIRRMALFPRLIEQAAHAHEPHRVAFYLYDLASEFHALWNRGKDLPHLRFIREDDRSLTTARLTLTAATASTLSAGLAILGVRAPEEMR